MDAAQERISINNAEEYKTTLVTLLSEDLNFHNYSSREYTHDMHSFPARFPAQLPRKFIHGLTKPDDIVLDPMMGSGTTILEAAIANRRSIGFDIDPLALHFCQVKTTLLSTDLVSEVGIGIVEAARTKSDTGDRQEEFSRRFDEKTKAFLDYWFHPDAQCELLALLREIEQIQIPDLRALLELTFSAIIITKSGGVSLAYDLAHTRPHKVKNKTYRSPIADFNQRLQRNIRSLLALPDKVGKPILSRCDAQHLAIDDNQIDLIVTSPPYPANAIDYMRAHKFSLSWLGYPIENLSILRKKYIGGEAINGTTFELLPQHTKSIIAKVASRDEKKSLVLTRYYSEVTRTLREMFRVLKPGKAAIVVVGSSNMRGIDTQVQLCLAEIGQQIGFEIPHIGIRQLDRDRRMLPFHRNKPQQSQIENRMQEEHVIGFYKPTEG